MATSKSKSKGSKVISANPMGNGCLGVLVLFVMLALVLIAKIYI